MQDFLEKIFWIEAQTKLAHWQEKNGFRHEVLGKFHSELSEKFDLLVEAFIGSTGNIAPLVSQTAYVLSNNIEMENLIRRISTIMHEITQDKRFQTSSLINITDDIATIIDKYTYLLGRE